MNKKSETRRRSGQSVHVRLDEDEARQINGLVDQTSATSAADLLRKAALGIPVNSLIDQKAAFEIRKLKGEISKLGGLIKTTHMILRDNTDHDQVLDQHVLELMDELGECRLLLTDLFGALAEPKLLDALAPLIHAPADRSTLAAIKAITR